MEELRYPIGPFKRRDSLDEETRADFARTYRHPVNGVWTLDAALSFFAWHNLHHTAHITKLHER